MNKYVFIALLSLFSVTANAVHVCGGDTIVKVVRPDSIVVTETDSVTRISVFGREGDSSYQFYYSKAFAPEGYSTISEHASKWNFSLPFQKNDSKGKAKYNLLGMYNIRYGITLPLNKTKDVHSQVGMNVGVDVVGVQTILPSRKNSLTLGLGVDIIQFKQRNGMQWIKRNGTLGTMAFPEGSHKRRSWFQGLALTLPLNYTHEFKKAEMGFSVIPELHFNGWVYNRYQINGKEVKDRYKGISQRKFGMSFRFNISSKRIGGIYLQYSPYKRFTAPDAPNYSTLSIGFIL